MGKFAAYLGSAIPVAAIAEGGTHPLAAPSLELTGGYGFGFHPDDGDPAPERWESGRPIWRDPRAMQLLRRVRARSVLAHAAAAEDPGVQIEPFVSGSLLFLELGEISRFHSVFARPMRERLSDVLLSRATSGSSRELCFLSFLDALGDDRGPEAIARALEQTADMVRELAMAADSPATFATLVTDGEVLVTLRTATHGAPPPMFTLVADESSPFPPGGRVIASEPLFPGEWSSLDPHSLVIFTTEATPIVE